MAHRKRVEALKALVIANVLPGTSAVVNDEFERVCQAGRIRQLPRRYLLEVIHASRALDTGLKVYIAQATGHHLRNIGGMLKFARDVGIHGNRLPASSHNSHYGAVAKVRNHYAHEAGAFPANSPEVEQLLDDMNACLAEIFLL